MEEMRGVIPCLKIETWAPELWFSVFRCLKSEAGGTQSGGGVFGFMIGTDDYAI